jgi:hypothetical protein
MCFYDGRFEKELSRDVFFRRVFNSLYSNEDVETSLARRLDTAVDVAKKFIEHGLMNRSTFACYQMMILSKSWKDVPDKDKPLALKRLRAEIDYVLKLLGPFFTESAMETKSRLLYWKQRNMGDEGKILNNSNNVVHTVPP